MLKKPVLGFTLIELLITITIISVLAAIGLVAYTNFVKSARDGKRSTDLKTIQSALEQYHADQHYYPSTITFGDSLTSPDGSKTYLNTVHTDPIGVDEYFYKSFLTSTSANSCEDPLFSGLECQYYILCAKLENPRPGSTSDCTDNSPAGNNHKVGYNTRVTPP